MSSSNLDIEWLRHVYELMDNSESARVSGVALLMRPGYCVATAGDLENCFLPDNTVEYKSNRNSFDSISAISKEAEELFKTSEDTFYCFGECSRVTEETLKAVRFQDKLYFPVKITECSYLAITKKRKEGIVLSSLSEGLLLVSHFKSPCVPNVRSIVCFFIQAK
eukprot:jgi/Galph1/2335/GphlegSOOS_G985.1